MRTLSHCNVSRHGNYIVIDVKGNAFLHHMVRNIAGSLIRVGQKQETVEWMAEVLAAKNRCLAGMTASAGGLYFVAVDYPEQFSLPEHAMGPFFLTD